MCVEMETTYNELAERLIQIVSSEDFKGSGKKRYVVGLAAPPGGGKTFTSIRVCNIINERLGSEAAVCVPMDGFHLYKRELDSQPNSEELYRRRGAHYTFNGVAFLNLVKRLRVEDELDAPSFDHKVGDPIENDIHILRQHKIAIVEGNYLLLDEYPWCELNKEFDESWYIKYTVTRD
eukprot:TRINITY_DN1011_c0_g1_i10.p1 TRINITY_DN1011_c0_g1~~TRINITY_DN1011_c0_g1_i10.p1  ORF type:complete len:178 (+),score=35.84 TRINITY_DN1011_c0_g1_i10:286-819(+)